MKAVCQRDPRHARFSTTVHELHVWEVDKGGDFLKDKGCLEVVHKPDRGNLWTCAVCGAEARVSAE